LCSHEYGFEILQVKDDQVIRILSPHNLTTSLQRNDMFLILYEIPSNAIVDSPELPDRGPEVSSLGEDILIARNREAMRGGD
jgi:hypothetical protein